jgi:hypothetical protein|nr:hypothetical protein [Herbaspirillum sp. B39]
MSNDLFHFAYLKPRDFALHGTSIDQWLSQAEPGDAPVQVTADTPEMLAQVTNGSRNGWMAAIIEELAQASALSDLGVLYGAENIAYAWEAPDTWENDAGEMTEWSRWKAIKLQDQALPTLAEAITRLFDWSSAHVDELAEDTFSDLCSADELADDIHQPILTSAPASDPRVRYGEDGEGSHCLYSFLHSLRQLCMNARNKDESVLLIVQT